MNKNKVSENFGGGVTDFIFGGGSPPPKRACRKPCNRSANIWQNISQTSQALSSMFYKSHVSFILVQHLVVQTDIDVCEDVLACWLNRRVSPSIGQVVNAFLKIIQNILSTDILTHLQYNSSKLYFLFMLLYVRSSKNLLLFLQCFLSRWGRQRSVRQQAARVSESPQNYLRFRATLALRTRSCSLFS